MLTARRLVISKKKKEFAGIVQLVEHLLAKEKVASSSLAARSFFYRGLCPLYGDVAKWQGKGLQNPHHRFKSDRRLNDPPSGGFFIIEGVTGDGYTGTVPGMISYRRLS